MTLTEALELDQALSDPIDWQEIAHLLEPGPPSGRRPKLTPEATRRWLDAMTVIEQARRESDTTPTRPVLPKEMTARDHDSPTPGARR